MRRALMVTPHFPPDSSAAAHRVRLLAPYLPEGGWTPTIVTVDPARYEGRLDRGLEALVPSSLRVIRAGAWPARITRRVGLGDLGLRAWTGLGRACRAELFRERYDVLFITVYPVYPALLGPRLKAQFRIPFVLDYQDPWVGEWGLTVGGGTGGRPDWKSRASRGLGAWLEPRAVAAADALTAVSQGTIDGIVDRIPAASRKPHGIIPLGFEPGDFDRLRMQPPSTTPFDASDGLVHICYVGTLLPKGVETLRLLLSAVRLARDRAPAAGRLRLHFFGTSNQSTGDRFRVRPLADACGVGDITTEMPGRLDYLDALSVLTHASVILLLGSSEPHYTASKLYPALLARRPILALFHESSSVVSILRAAAHAPSVRIVTYGSGVVDGARVEEVAGHVGALAECCAYDDRDVSLAQAEGVSARSLARRLAEIFDLVAVGSGPTVTSY